MGLLSLDDVPGEVGGHEVQAARPTPEAGQTAMVILSAPGKWKLIS